MGYFPHQNESKYESQSLYMLFAGWEVRTVKNCDRGLENAARDRLEKNESLYDSQT